MKNQALITLLAAKGRRILTQMSLILFAAGGIGLMFNQLRPDGIPVIGTRPTLTPDTTLNAKVVGGINYSQPGEPRGITFASAKQLFDQRQAIFIDARKPELFTAGHIAGARLLTWSGPDAPPEIPTDLDRRQLYVIYCIDVQCEIALELAFYLYAQDFQFLRVYPGGYQEWSAAGYPIEKGAPQ